VNPVTRRHTRGQCRGHGINVQLEHANERRARPMHLPADLVSPHPDPDQIRTLENAARLGRIDQIQ
jgi:hypothetical protein